MLKNVRSPGPDRRSRTAGSCRSANGSPSSDRKRVSVSWDAMTSLKIENFYMYRESRTANQAPSDWRGPTGTETAIRSRTAFVRRMAVIFEPVLAYEDGM